MEITTVFQMKAFYNLIQNTMIYLNYNNLDAETQNRLLSKSKADIKRKHGRELQAFSKRHQLDFEEVLYEEAIKNLYNYKYKFNI